MEKVLKDLEEWKEYVSIPREELEGFSICPFAKKAEIVYDFIKSEQEIIIDMIKRERSNVEMFMLVDVNNVLDTRTAVSIAKFFNDISDKYKYFLDDYQNPQYMNCTVPVSNNNYLIIIGQRIDILENARKKLRKTSYYKFLDKEYLREIGVDYE